MTSLAGDARWWDDVLYQSVSTHPSSHPLFRPPSLTHSISHSIPYKHTHSLSKDSRPQDHSHADSQTLSLLCCRLPGSDSAAPNNMSATHPSATHPRATHPSCSPGCLQVIGCSGANSYASARLPLTVLWQKGQEIPVACTRSDSRDCDCGH